MCFTILTCYLVIMIAYETICSISGVFRCVKRFFIKLFFSVFQIFFQNIKIRNQNSLMFRKNIFRIQFFEPKAFPAAVICSVPEKPKHFIGQIIQQIFMTVKDQEKAMPPCFSNCCMNST